MPNPIKLTDRDVRTVNAAWQLTRNGRSRATRRAAAASGAGHDTGIVAALAELEGEATVPKIGVLVRSATPEAVVIPVE